MSLKGRGEIFRKINEVMYYATNGCVKLIYEKPKILLSLITLKSRQDDF